MMSLLNSIYKGFLLLLKINAKITFKKDLVVNLFMSLTTVYQTFHIHVSELNNCRDETHQMKAILSFQ